MCVGLYKEKMLVSGGLSLILQRAVSHKPGTAKKLKWKCLSLLLLVTGAWLMAVVDPLSLNVSKSGLGACLEEKQVNEFGFGMCMVEHQWTGGQKERSIGPSSISICEMGLQATGCGKHLLAGKILW